MATSNAIQARKDDKRLRRKQELRTREQLRAFFTVRPKVSLRGLLLLTLAIGSGMAFHQNMNPWAPTTTVSGHKGGVLCQAWSPDGTILATGGMDGSIRLWNAQTGAVISVITAHEGHANCVAFAADGTRIVSGGEDGVARVWNVSNGKLEVDLRPGAWGNPAIYSAAFSPDGKRIVSVSGDGQPITWNADNGNRLRTHYPWRQGGLRSSAVSATFLNNDQIEAATGDGRIIIWDIKNTYATAYLNGEVGTFRGGTFSSDKSHVIAGGDGCTAQVWKTDSVEDKTNPDIRRRWSAKNVMALKGHTGCVIGGQFAPDGSRLLTTSTDGTVRLWQGQHYDALATLEGGGNAIMAATFSPDSQRVAVSAGAQTSIWERRRPEAAWGMLLMPELWATLLFSGAGFWFIRRDRPSKKSATAKSSKPEPVEPTADVIDTTVSLEPITGIAGAAQAKRLARRTAQ